MKSVAPALGAGNGVVLKPHEETSVMGGTLIAKIFEEAGRGFSVVADEIRKLATNSKENVTQIDEIVKTMQTAISNLNKAFSGINEFTDHQAAAIEEISATVMEISTNAQQLSQMAGNHLTEER